MADADCIHSLSFLEPVRRCLQSLSLSCIGSECAAADALRYLRSNFPSLPRLELCHTFKEEEISEEQRAAFLSLPNFIPSLQHASCEY